MPPVERRDTIPKILYPRFKKESDDTYIAYLCFKRSLIVGAILAALNWISYTYGIRFDFRLFAIDIPKEDFVEALIFSFPKYTSAILLAAILPFHVIQFRLHINPRTFDLLWWNSYFTIRARRRRGKVLFHFVFALFFIPFAMLGSYGLPYFAMEGGGYQQSLQFFLIMLLLFSMFLAWANGLLVMTTGVVWRYVGKYEGE